MESVEPAYDEPAYDKLAVLYDRAFSDIRLRRVEWRWLTAQLGALPASPRVLELGCGTGAVLRALEPRLSVGVGVDVSPAMLERASERARERRDASRLSFVHVTDSQLPFAAGSFDVVLSFLSFRYLDWPRSFAEVRRVLAPGGRFLMIDLVAAPSAAHELLALGRSALRHVATRLREPRFVRELGVLTSHPAWRAMLRRHPMRELGEYRRFFEQQQTGVRLETLDMTPSRRVVALSIEPARSAPSGARAER